MVIELNEDNLFHSWTFVKVYTKQEKLEKSNLISRIN